MTNSMQFGLKGTRLFSLVLLASVVLFNSAAKAESDLVLRGTYQPWTSPGITTASPTGFGAQWGDIFIGGGFTSKTRTSASADGSMGLGFGLGDSKEYVGIETSMAITDLSGFNRGGLGVKIHRMFGDTFGVAFGRELLAQWGGADLKSRSWFFSMSNSFQLADPGDSFSSLAITVGLGDGRFRSQTNFNAGIQQWNLFASAALRVLEPMSVILDWTGQDLNIGLSITPFQSTALFINPGLADVTGTTTGGAKFTLSAGYAFNFNS